MLIDYVVNKSKNDGCYKVILDCKEEKVGFYEKCGLIRKGCEIAVYF